ncbi:hypothetical protein K9L05_02305 [Candidatus Babeliales bacterium]|nr:hypothetical protein [Candidatus Babeliales bacterium]MCF7899459.1 hypothetical protein [Candidatus Babeliales bacterium]
MIKRPSFDDFKKIVFKDKKFVGEYETLRPEFELLIKFIKAPKSAKNYLCVKIK